MRRNRIDASGWAYVSACLMVLGAMLAIFFITGCAPKMVAIPTASGKDDIVIERGSRGIYAEPSRIFLRPRSVLFDSIADIEIKPGQAQDTLVAIISVRDIDPAWIAGFIFEFEDPFFEAEVSNISPTSFNESGERGKITSEQRQESPDKVFSVTLRPRRAGETLVRIAIKVRSKAIAPVLIIDSHIAFRIM